MLLNLFLAQLRKNEFFLNIHSSRFDISLALALLSSFSLAERVQASLTLARSCVSCTKFMKHEDTLARCKYTKVNFAYSLAYSYLCTIIENIFIFSIQN